MNGVNKTLYIPLYSKSFVSQKGLFLDDQKAEEIWDAEGFSLKRKSKSKWLSYYLGVRAAVFDEWLQQQLAILPDAIVIHIGCGLDSRVMRLGDKNHKWYDVDVPEVIKERKRYYTEADHYEMIAGDARDCKWLSEIKETSSAIVIMEGVSMYLMVKDMQRLIDRLCNHFKEIKLLVDCYSTFAAKMSRYKNPINDVGVTETYGIDSPEAYENGNFTFVQEHTMIPQKYINELHGLEKLIFSKLYAGTFSRNLYRLLEYKKTSEG